MNTIEIADATDSLADFADSVRDDPLIVTRSGKAIAVLVPLAEDEDLESIALSANPKFMAMIERSRATSREKGTLSAAEVRSMLTGAGKP